jgi:hypothetical protein
MERMIKIIIKEETLKLDLKNKVKEDGWKKTSELVGGPENLAKIAFNDDPLEYLNGLELRKVRYTNQPHRIHFVDDKGTSFLSSPLNQRTVNVSYENINEFLYEGFKMENNKLRKLLMYWLNDEYDFHFDTVRNIR